MSVDMGKLAQNISILHRQYYKDTKQDFNQYGLNPTAVCMLLMIQEYPGSNQQFLVDKLVIDKSHATREINELTTLGYITRTSGVGHSSELYLTAKGEQLIPTIQKIRSDWWTDQFAKTATKPEDPLALTIQTVVTEIVGPA